MELNQYKWSSRDTGVRRNEVLEKTQKDPDENIIMNNHSSIVSYPIDYVKFPLAKKCNFIEVTLTNNQYLLIPAGWYHWVYTEPRTIAMSYKILKYARGHQDPGDINRTKFSSGESNNTLYKSIANNTPIRGTGKDVSIEYDQFINKYSNRKFRAMYSSIFDNSPVIKRNDVEKFYDIIALQDIIHKTQQGNYYTYIGMNDINNNNFNEFKYIEDFIDFGDDVLFKYEPFLWLSLETKVNSGLHNDGSPGILYVLTGTKKIFLAPPNERPNLYITSMVHI